VLTYEGYCKTDSKGQLFIYNRNLFNDFFGQNPSKDFVFKIEAVSSKPKNKMIAYLNAEVLPKVVSGFRTLGENHNTISVVQELKKYCPVLHHYQIIDGNLLPVSRELEELNYFELKRLIDEIIIFASEQLETKIDEPK